MVDYHSLKSLFALVDNIFIGWNFMAEAHGSLHRAIAVLRSLGAGEDAGLRLTELAAAVDLPRPTA
ncbi:helix-turn-helix domain-containing protein, partial [Stenotrophomonas maltophilia]|uniref:helix-turn-helix domain-containing protein n=1 Tax=Stenotrophomonas maltophilia TaxID=40324 RepID=UPI0013D966D9